MRYWKRPTVRSAPWFAAVVGLVALSLGGCGAGMPNYDYSQEPDPRNSEFVIGVSDGLNITVWKNADLTTTATVRPDGTITMPLIGDLQASGKTPSQLKAEIQTKLGQFIRDESAVVTVAITAVNSYRFTVTGQFTSPGVFTSQYFVTVADAVALAGGTTRFAKPDRAVIFRRDRAGTRKIPLNLKMLASGQHPEMNIVILAGDTLHCP